MTRNDTVTPRLARAVARVAVAAALCLVPAAATLVIDPAPAHADELKVGIVDFARALKSTEGAGGALAKLEGDASERAKALRSLEDEILVMEQEIKENSQVYSEEKKMEVYMAYRKKVAEYREAVVRNQAEFDEQRNKVLGAIQQTMQQISVEIAQDKKLDLMLERNEGAVIYFDNAFDFTDELISRYEARTGSAKKN